ncbi:MAG: FAD-dependent oxidoreductase, partial [Deltaproteobacteria bacterium]|nr:FAD-dependent oxidoreductase [Deltaproteobacteria bacterium]
PPRAARAIAADLAPEARRFLDGARTGSVVKCFAAYDRAFWRDAGLSGEVYAPSGLVRAVVDASPPGDGAILLAFVVGAAARAWSERDPAERRAHVLAELARFLGEPAAHPIDYAEADWSAEGCVYLATSPSWRPAHGTIHIAGTESAVAWPGYMEGAIEAGERAAGEVLRELTGR